MLSLGWINQDYEGLKPHDLWYDWALVDKESSQTLAYQILTMIAHTLWVLTHTIGVLTKFVLFLCSSTIHNNVARRTKSFQYFQEQKIQVSSVSYQLQSHVSYQLQSHLSSHLYPLSKSRLTVVLCPISNETICIDSLLICAFEDSTDVITPAWFDLWF